MPLLAARSLPQEQVAFLWVGGSLLNFAKKSVFKFFGAGRGGSLVGRRKGGGGGRGRQVGWVRVAWSGVGCVGGSGLGGGRQAQEEGVGAGGWGWAEGPPARNGFGCWTSGLEGEGVGAGQARTERFCGLAVTNRRLNPTKKSVFEFVGAGRGNPWSGGGRARGVGEKGGRSGGGGVWVVDFGLGRSRG